MAVYQKSTYCSNMKQMLNSFLLTVCGERIRTKWMQDNTMGCALPLHNVEGVSIRVEKGLLYFHSNMIHTDKFSPKTTMNRLEEYVKAYVLYMVNIH